MHGDKILYIYFLPNVLRVRLMKRMVHFLKYEAAFLFLSVKQGIIVSDHKDHINDMLCWIFFSLCFLCLSFIKVYPWSHLSSDRPGLVVRKPQCQSRVHQLIQAQGKHVRTKV